MKPLAPTGAYKEAYYNNIKKGKTEEQAHELGRKACEAFVASRLKDPEKHKHGHETLLPVLFGTQNALVIGAAMDAY